MGTPFVVKKELTQVVVDTKMELIENAAEETWKVFTIVSMNTFLVEPILFRMGLLFSHVLLLQTFSRSLSDRKKKKKNHDNKKVYQK